jgi:hypothetical protein
MPGTLTYNLEPDCDAEKRASIIRAIGRSGKIIVMCGAGISTAVGIPVCDITSSKQIRLVRVGFWKRQLAPNSFPSSRRV